MTVHELMHEGGGDSGLRAQQRRELKSLFGEATNARESEGVPQLSSRSVGRWIAGKEGRIRGQYRFVRGTEAENGVIWKTVGADGRAPGAGDAT